MTLRLTSRKTWTSLQINDEVISRIESLAGAEGVLLTEYNEILLQDTEIYKAEAKRTNSSAR